MTILDLSKHKPTTIINIPDFDGIGTVQVEVQRLRLAQIITDESIPNDLLALAVRASVGTFKSSVETEEDRAKEVKKNIQTTYFYCEQCLVKPSWEDFKDVITDEQAIAIQAWAIASPEQLRSFRDVQESNTNNPNGTPLQEVAKRNTKAK